MGTSQKKVLVTGASGFVGGALAKELLGQNFEVIGVSRRPSQHGKTVCADLTLPVKIDFTPDVVVHAAARSSPWGSARQFEMQNIKATRNVIDFCESKGAPHLIYISTSAVLYRNEHQFGMDESEPPPPIFINEYARTKYAGEELVRQYPGKWTILRPRAVFGPGDTVLFPRILRAAQRGKLPIIESEQTVMADLIYIDCLVAYIERVIEQGTEGLYHLTNDHPVPVVEFLCDIFRRLGLPEPKRRIPIGHAMMAAGAIEMIYRALPFLGEPPITRFGVSVFAYSKTLDIGNALRDLGPPSIPLNAAVEQFIQWQKAQGV